MFPCRGVSLEIFEAFRIADDRKGGAKYVKYDRLDIWMLYVQT